MINFQEKFLKILYAGIFLIAAYIIGISIASTNKYNDIIKMQNNIYLAPKIISYILIAIGVMGYLNIFNRFLNKRKD